MKAYLIDPEARTISTIDIRAGHVLRDLYAAIDCELVECVAGFPIAGHDAWIDEEGFLYDEPRHGLFALPDTHQQIYAGRAVIMGTNDEGDSIEATCTAEDIQARAFAVLDLNRQRVVCGPLTIATHDSPAADNQGHADACRA